MCTKTCVKIFIVWNSKNFKVISILSAGECLDNLRCHISHMVKYREIAKKNKVYFCVLAWEDHHGKTSQYMVKIHPCDICQLWKLILKNQSGIKKINLVTLHQIKKEQLKMEKDIARCFYEYKDRDLSGKKKEPRDILKNDFKGLYDRFLI